MVLWLGMILELEVYLPKVLQKGPEEKFVWAACNPKRNPTMLYLPMLDLADIAHTFHQRAIHWGQRNRQNDLQGCWKPTLALSFRMRIRYGLILIAFAHNVPFTLCEVAL